MMMYCTVCWGFQNKNQQTALGLLTSFYILRDFCTLLSFFSNLENTLQGLCSPVVRKVDSHLSRCITMNYSKSIIFILFEKKFWSKFFWACSKNIITLCYLELCPHILLQVPFSATWPYTYLLIISNINFKKETTSVIPNSATLL